MANYILIATICVCLLSIYISRLGRQREAMDDYIRCFLGYLALHAIHAWVVRTHFEDNMRLDYYAPYGLSYGPFLYFAYQVASGKPLKKGQVLLHQLPFLVFTIVYFLWLCVPSLFVDHLRLVSISLYSTLSLSLLSYAIWALFFKSAVAEMRNNREIRMISVMAIVLAFIAAILVVFTYSSTISGHVQSQFKGSVVFLTMLSAALILFSYIVNQIVGNAGKTSGKYPALKKDTFTPPAAKDVPREDTHETRYRKSGISDGQLEAYEASVRQHIEQEQGYLNDDLVLKSLAQQLRIPKHHLSQVFTLRIGKNFNTYVNAHRVTHAIRLMHNHPEMNITDIYLNSGFNSKTSFNRYFKQFKGCTPTEYRLRVQDR